MTFDERELLRAGRRLHRLILKRYGGKMPKTCEVPEVDELDYPAWLPGEMPPRKPDRSAGVQIYFDPRGLPIVGTMSEQLAEHIRYRKMPENHIESRPFFRGGVRIWVSTVHLGLDNGFLSDAVMGWETMVFAGHMGGRGQWRFATRAAALAAHADLVRRIAEGQRLRRLAWQHRPSRRARFA